MFVGAGVFLPAQNSPFIHVPICNVIVVNAAIHAVISIPDYINTCANNHTAICISIDVHTHTDMDGNATIRTTDNTTNLGEDHAAICIAMHGIIVATGCCTMRCRDHIAQSPVLILIFPKDGTEKLEWQ